MAEGVTQSEFRKGAPVIESNQLVLKPVERANVMESVAESLLDQIRAGHLKPGDRLPPQKELALMLHVSLPTLREALAGLAMLGYVEARVGQGYFVRRMDSTEILDFSVISALVSDETIVHLYEARAVIETHQVELAALRATDEEIARLYRFLDEVERSVPDAEAIQKGLEFHRLVAEMAHNPVLLQIETSLLALFREYVPRIFPQAPTYQNDVELHLQIVRMIEKHDRAGARKAALDHLRAFAREIDIPEPWA